MSLGAQSFSDAHLQVLGRIHAATDTRRAAEELHAAALSNFNLDLMYALPQQTMEQARADIRAALALAPAHVSHYQLTLEPGTVFGALPPAGLPDPDGGADMQLACQQQLAEAGLQQYEVSGYAREHARCRHNLNYWRFGDYLGIGAGAHGKCSRIEQGRLVIERTTQAARAAALSAQRRRGERRVRSRRRSAVRVPDEYAALEGGFRRGRFRGAHRLALRAAGRAARAAAGPRADRAGRRPAGAPARRGFDFLNDLLADFLPTASIV